MLKQKAMVLSTTFLAILGGCKDTSQPAQNNSQSAQNHPQPAQDAPHQAEDTSGQSQGASLTENERHIALTNVTSNFQFNQYSLTAAKSQTQQGKWSVISTEGDCGDDETCFNVVFKMPDTSDAPSWHFRFDRASGLLNRMNDIDENVNDKYFMVVPSSRGSADARP